MFFVSGILIGIVGSLHCVGMCGPLVMAINYKQKGIFKNLLYHGGRLMSYATLGVIFGMLGKGFSMAGWQQLLSVLAGVTIILITLLPKLKVNYLQNRWQQSVLTPMKRKLLSAVNKGAYSTMLSLGLLNGLLPCGLVYVALAASVASSNPMDGAVLMSGFGLATLPVMLTMTFGGSWLMKRFRHQLHYAIPFMAIFMGTLLVLRGLSLDIPFVSPVLSSVFGPEITICR